MVALKKVLAAFQLGIRMQSTDEDENFQLSFESDVVFNDIMALSIEHTPRILFDFLKFDLSAVNVSSSASYHSNATMLPSCNAKWKKVRVVAKSFVFSVIGLMEQLSDPKALQYFLKELNDCGGMLLLPCFPKSQYPKKFLKVSKGILFF